MDAFAKSDDERDFFLDRKEGFLIFADLDENQTELDKLEKELQSHPEKYAKIPKLTFFETKKIMEGFTNEKVYDIDIKEKLLDIIQGKEPREQFLEFLHDQHDAEWEKWQQYYQERSRIRIIEWLRQENLRFVFEEDLDLPLPVMEKVKKSFFEEKVPRDLAQARKQLHNKAETYYSNEALNPRPKRGRPPKNQTKTESEPTYTPDYYISVPPAARPFLFVPDVKGLGSVTFSAKYESEEEFLASLRAQREPDGGVSDELTRKLASLRKLATRGAKPTLPQSRLASLSEEIAEKESTASPKKRRE